MTIHPSRALAASRPFITFLIALNLVYALCIGLLLIGTVVIPFFKPGWPWEALGFGTDGSHPLRPLGLQAICFLGIVGAVLVHVVLRWMRAIVDTVRIGDPFIRDNARRLRGIAWCVLGGQGLGLGIVAISKAVSTQAQPVDIGNSFSFTPWLAILLLFVLAEVFAHGARMRTDLEGTV